MPRVSSSLVRPGRLVASSFGLFRSVVAAAVRSGRDRGRQLMLAVVPEVLVSVAPATAAMLRRVLVHLLRAGSEVLRAVVVVASNVSHCHAKVSIRV